MNERDVILRLRQAFADGAVCWVGECRSRTHNYPPGPSITLDEITGDAARKFPLPKITRPRVVHENGSWWCVIEGELQWSCTGVVWQDADGSISPTAARIKMWADLLAQPTETVEDA